jgi:DNA-binding MarR family transcriptional regulator
MRIKLPHQHTLPAPHQHDLLKFVICLRYILICLQKVWIHTIIVRTMLLLKELPTSKSLEKFVRRYPDADIAAISDFVNLLRACSDISTALDKLLAKHELLQGRWWVLVLLMRQDDLTSSPTDLAEKAGVTKATMTGFIDGLVRDGLVTRLMDSVDRRKLLIKLTEAGQQKLDVVLPDYYKKVSALMTQLNGDQRASLLVSVNILASGLEVMK